MRRRRTFAFRWRRREIAICRAAAAVRPTLASSEICINSLLNCRRPRAACDTPSSHRPRRRRRFLTELSIGPLCVTQPNPTHQKLKNLDPTRPNAWVNPDPSGYRTPIGAWDIWLCQEKCLDGLSRSSRKNKEAIARWVPDRFPRTTLISHHPIVLGGLPSRSPARMRGRTRAPAAAAFVIVNNGNELQRLQRRPAGTSNFRRVQRSSDDDGSCC